MTGEQNARWKSKRKQLATKIFKAIGIRTMEIGRGNTGSGLTGTNINIQSFSAFLVRLFFTYLTSATLPIFRWGST